MDSCNNRLSVRGVWCGPEDAGRTPDDVAAFVERLHEAHVNLVVMCVKGVGRIYWPSLLFREAVAPGYADYDMPAVLLAECRRRGMQAHAWFIDFMESADGPAYGLHPEWAMRNAMGDTTASETLRGSPYPWVWMCPARRPGYADQWLIPMMREFAERYAFDAIHHDYLRYPGDLAPDQYCFCDDCLTDLPRYASYVTEAYRSEPFFHESYDRPYVESHWEQSPRVLPANWDRLPRSMKSRFLLEGSTFAGGRNDLDYFFYLYRVDAMTRFAREAAAAIRGARPGIGLSAAVFKNPVQSGRFIGQDWRTFGPYIDVAMPMDYRDHYPGGFDTYLTLLAESIERQKEWAQGYRALWPGIAVNFLYQEEQRPLERLAKALETGIAVQTAFSEAAACLELHAPDLYRKIALSLEDGTTDACVEMGMAIAALLKAPPGGLCPEEKLTRTIERIRDTGVDGICLFSAGLVSRYGMWDAVRDVFG